jgi:hydroxyacylglutathione hydrolase
MTIHVTEIACLSDNYAYLVGREGEPDVVVVDPSEAEPVSRELARQGKRLVAILNTHHHWDHVGGNEALAASHPGLSVYAHQSDRGRVAAQTHDVIEGEPVEVAGMCFDTLHIPGHTTGAVAYVIEDAVFTGDTLFIAGCGRLFEGTPAMMHASLNDKLAALPAATKVYPGHEYTVSNLLFAQTMEPDNTDVGDKLAWAQAERAAGRATVPSTIGEEKRVNPFMRVGEKALVARFGDDAVAAFAELRAAKDAF